MVDFTNFQQAPNVQPAIANVQPVQTARAYDGISNAVAQVTQTGVDEIIRDRTQEVRQDLRRNIGSLSREVGFLNSNARTQQALLNSPNSTIDTTSERFRTLALARSQGRVPETEVGIAVEAELKKAIREAPALEGELRVLARDLVHYDPTGFEIRALLAPRELSPEEEQSRRDQQTVDDFNAQYPGINYTVQRLRGERAADQIYTTRKNARQAELAEQQITTEDYISEQTADLGLQIPSILRNLQTLIADPERGTQGLSSEQLSFYVNDLRRQKFDEIVNDLRVNGYRDTEQNRNYINGQLDRWIGYIEQFAGNSGALELYQENTQLFNAISADRFQRDFPLISEATAVLGKEQAARWMELRFSSNDEAFRIGTTSLGPVGEFIRSRFRNRPSTGPGSTVVPQGPITRNEIRQFRDLASDVGFTMLQGLPVEANTPKTVVDYVAQDVFTNGDTESSKAVWDSLISSGAPRVAVSILKRPGMAARHGGTQTGRDFVNRYEVAKRQLLPEITERLAANPDVELFVTDTGNVSARLTERAALERSAGRPNLLPSQAGLTGDAADEALQTSLDQINDFLESSRNGWQIYFNETPQELVREIQRSQEQADDIRARREEVQAAEARTRLELQEGVSDVVPGTLAELLSGETFRRSLLNPPRGRLAGQGAILEGRESLQARLERADRIAREQGRSETTAYVLENFTPEEITQLTRTIAPVGG